MKRFSTWAAIFGIILLGSSLISLGTLIANPTDMVDVNVAMAASNVALGALGGFLLFAFFFWKQREEQDKVDAEFSKDSEQNLKRSRNWILGFVLLITVIGSLEPWILNNYLAGVTLVNIFVVFDLFACLVLLYCAIELFRNKRDVSKLLLTAVIIYAVVEGVLLFVRGFWFGPIVNLAMAAYFAFALLAPLTRKNHRIAHLVLLPIAVAVLLAWSEFDNGNLPALSDQYALSEQRFTQDASTLQGAYNIFLQKQDPSTADISSVRIGIENREESIAELLVGLDQLEEEYLNRMPSVDQRKILASYRYVRQLLAAHQEQGQILKEFMDYAATIDLGNPSPAQVDRIVEYQSRIEEVQSKLTEIDFKFANANIGVEQ